VSYGGEIYQTVVICDQTWMARNLNVMHNSGNGDSWCYDDDESNCDTYGRLYNWAAAMNLPSSCNSSSCASQVSSKHQGICPNGWHIPSDSEWKTLIKNVGGSAGTKLKTTSGWNESDTGWPPTGTDDFGFAALPGGTGGGGDWGSYFFEAGDFGHWCSSTEYNSSNPWYAQIYYDLEVNYRSNFYKTSLCSVRCLQDYAP
jgi:uncharacterized protein (TIGR02145 family)